MTVNTVSSTTSPHSQYFKLMHALFFSSSLCAQTLFYRICIAYCCVLSMVKINGSSSTSSTTSSALSHRIYENGVWVDLGLGHVDLADPWTSCGLATPLHSRVTRGVGATMSPSESRQIADGRTDGPCRSRRMNCVCVCVCVFDLRDWILDVDVRPRYTDDVAPQSMS